ncbi:hypothetical protein AGRA3207_003702 [Actinomadura graeca]|uniref:Uncharacterized protein n=1 Tax=Actinomadura graeca TaxID=2750812 RepID=A0ABX8QWG2_9ACTN|nr:hypothetical protein [Actinomadura graeca]QXJ22661.1 hypothetical protein AGRA3207_003702 [Actinomadura graeca]
MSQGESTVGAAPPDVTGSWLHSFEEDTGTTEVYRPSAYRFRPARRVRGGLEFRPDGTFVERRPGPDDRLYEVQGRWAAQGAGRIGVTFPQGRAAPYEITVVSRTQDMLAITR